MGPAVQQPQRRFDTLASLAAGRRAFSATLAVPCPAHRAKKGQPCWLVPGDRPSRPHHGVCGPRVRAAGFVRRSPVPGVEAATRAEGRASTTPGGIR